MSRNVDMARKFHKPDVFNRQKENALSSVDLSRKGSIDSHIVDLVEYINTSMEYFTTSSCSGRIIIFEQVSRLDLESIESHILNNPVVYLNSP